MRVQALQNLFERIARERMHDVPICNHRLQVATIGFTPYQWIALQNNNQLDAQSSTQSHAQSCEHNHDAVSNISGSLGVLITPWCVNWVFLADDARQHPPVGVERVHQWGADRYMFIGAYEDFGGSHPFGGFEACSLVSPVLEFADQAAVVALAQGVMQEWHQMQDALRIAQEKATQLAAQQALADAQIDSSRRNFLRGRVRQT